MTQQFRYTDLVLNPDYFLHSVSLREGNLNFMEVTRDSYTKSAFLDGRIAYTRNRRHGINLGQLMQAFHANPVPRRTAHFIFHISFCCSTLLARALNLEGRSFSLREPYALIDLAHFKRSWPDPSAIAQQDWNALLDFVLSLLSKTYRSEEIVIVKPSNIANALIGDILELRADTRAVLLYCDIESFVVGNLKKTEETKQKMWWLAKMFVKDSDFVERVGDIDIDKLSHLQAVTLLWYLQMYHFWQHLQSSNAPRLRSLDCSVLLERPNETLAAACAFLGLKASSAELERIVAGPVFNTHAKNPFAHYDKTQRARENARLAEAHRSEIAETLAWSAAQFGASGVPSTLPRALLN